MKSDTNLRLQRNEARKEANSLREQLAASQRECARLATAVKMCREGVYMNWHNAGGPNECIHGYADGIPCAECDYAFALEVLKPKSES